MRKVIIVIPNGFARAELVDARGDWAVTIHGNVASLTHLPTGSRLPTASDATVSGLLAALPDLAELPRFDLQAWERNRAAVKAVLEQRGLVA